MDEIDTQVDLKNLAREKDYERTKKSMIINL